MARVAAIFAHPDDEVLGCGASLALHARKGDAVSILILATGLSARGAAAGPQLESLRDQGRAAARTLGAKGVEFRSLPDNAMDSVPLLDVVREVEEFLGKVRPAVIYTHHAGDLNVDHRTVHHAVLTACRPLPGAGDVEILSSEVNSSTEWAPPSLQPFVPTDFLDVSAAIDAKVAALECYAGEVRPWPHPRSPEGVRALARWRGAQSGFEAAEAFQLVRRVRSALR